jgi:hypothetical protein
MSPSPITSPTRLTATSTGTNRGGVPLRGLRLRLLQALWVILVLCDLFVLIVSLPAFYRALHTVCTLPIAVDCSGYFDQLTPQALAALQHAGISPHAYALYVFTWDLLTTLAFLLVGAVIIWRRANTWMGLFVSFFLLSFASIGVSLDHVLVLQNVPSDNAFVLLGAIVGGLLVPLAYLCLAFFFFTFPDGRLVPRWSWALISLWIMNSAFWSAPADSPFNILNWPLWLQSLELFIVFGGSVATQVYRYRRVASPVQRQQIKWLIYGFAPALVLPICFGLVLVLFPALNSPGSLLWVAVEPLWRFYYLPIPFCIGIALLRYRLWDIDRVINRTLVYGLLTAILLLTYILLVFAGQHLLVSLLGQSNGVVLVGSTLIVAALFQPLRHRIQRIIDRRFYRSKYDAAKIVAAYSATLRNEVDLDQLQDHLLAVVQETMQPAHVSLWLRKPEQGGKRSSEKRSANDV